MHGPNNSLSQVITATIYFEMSDSEYSLRMNLARSTGG